MGALNPSHIFHKELVHPSPEGDGNDGDGNGVGGGRFECCGYAGCGMDVVMNLLFIECPGHLLGCSRRNHP